MGQDTKSTKSRVKNWIVQILKIAFSAAIIYWLVSSGKLNFAALGKIFTWQFGPLAFLLVFFNLFFASERWRFLLKTQNVEQRPWPAFKLTLIGVFFNYAMPGGVGGDVIKAYYFAKDAHGSRVVAVTSVLMDRVLGLYGMVLMALAVMIYDIQHVLSIPTLHSLFIFICFLFASFTIGFAIVFSKYIREKNWLKNFLAKLPMSARFLKLYDSLYLYGHSYKTLIFAVVVSLVAQTCSILLLALVGAASGVYVPLQTYFLVAPLGFMAIAIPISPAGVGVGQAAFYFLFNLYTGQKTELGPTTITALQVINFIFSLSGAFFYLQRKDRVKELDISAEAL